MDGINELLESPALDVCKGPRSQIPAGEVNAHLLVGEVRHIYLLACAGVTSFWLRENRSVEGLRRAATISRVCFKDSCESTTL